ncbi:MAG: macro domain-containing protein [Roseivirga sp.]|nr:macro domain-containing protein [Roseivirga sp.]
MNLLQFTHGDATAPIGTGPKIIVHICNNIGGWGRGFVLALSKKWSEPEQQYRQWYKSDEGFELGEIQLVPVEKDLWVANLIGQHKIRKDEKGNPPIRYRAVEQGLAALAQKAKELKASVHMPRIGCGLAGGKWEKIEPLIQKTLIPSKIEVTVYDF